MHRNHIKQYITIMTIEELRELFIIGKDATKDVIKGRFDLIAKALFNNFAIKSGNDYYTFKEIEFYFYNRYHKDIITHPRNSEPMQFYVNDFGGIDINFESKIKFREFKREKDKNDTIIKRRYVLDDNAYFGGVLIRQLRKYTKSNKGLDYVELLDGPWKCADLFRKLSEKLPVLEEYSNEKKVEKFVPQKRKNVIVKTEGKAQFIIDLYSSLGSEYDIKDLSSFNKYSDSPYRYVN